MKINIIFLNLIHIQDMDLINSTIIIMSRGMRFQQFDILTSVDSDEPLQPPFKLRNSK